MNEPSLPKMLWALFLCLMVFFASVLGLVGIWRGWQFNWAQRAFISVCIFGFACRYVADELGQDFRR